MSYNTRDLLRVCLESVRPEGAAETIVVDNVSTDGSAEMVQAEFPWVALCRNEVNDGYGAAANRAFAACASKYVLLLNGDTVLRPGAAEALAAYLDRNPRVAIAGPRLVNPDGTLQASCCPFPLPLAVFLEFSGAYRLIRRIPALRDRILRTWSHTKVRSVPWVVGAALAIRREAFEDVGGFDESFFMYFEEVDLCHRLAGAGWQVHFAPVAEVIHVGGASTRQRRGEMELQLFRGLGQFYRRHYSRARSAELNLLVRGIALGRLTRDLGLGRLTRDPLERARLAENVAAWRRLLLGHWRGQTKRGEVCSIGLVHE